PAPEKWHNHFDGILLDVPCSNTGVLRKRIDARWRMTPDSFTQLCELQLNILSNALPCVKVGGRIVYSTCSIDTVENGELIKQFLTDHPEFELTKEQQIYPFEHQTDGAYAAVLTRTA
ncbi:MAG: 16S rRNA (cytosine967-C5)-methyltransferase, partial [Cryomorphaceae bacterium]